MDQPGRVTPSHPPAVGRLINTVEYQGLCERYPRPLVVTALRACLNEESIDGPAPEQHRLDRVTDLLREWTCPRLRPVINGTGVILNTNLGRAPLSPGAVAAVARVAGRYSNVEYDLRSGTRGDRQAIVSRSLSLVTGARASLVVNNNAAAILLALRVLARRRDVIVSRSEQVEIGGSFRMPDVMKLSGARMVEVGTTNRTRALDYAGGITKRTVALLKVHQSNFRIIGFTEEPTLRELRSLADRAGILLIYDLGSGALDAFADEPRVSEAVALADVVTFSGDKLLGGPQCGIILGPEDVVARLAKDPLARALRVDKLTLAALETTLVERLRSIPTPVSRLWSIPADQLRARAMRLSDELRRHGIDCGVVEATALAGGGALPDRPLPTYVLALPGPAEPVAEKLRSASPPVIARITGGRCTIDVRTILDDEEADLVGAVRAIFANAFPPREQRA